MIGLIGAGAMGGGIAGTLARAFQDVCVFDVDPARREAVRVAGAQVASSADEVVRRCDPVLLSLPSSAVLVSVMEESVIPAVREGQTAIDFGTTVISETRRLHGRMKDRGAAFLDSPVSGGRVGAAQGNLYVFVGGDRDQASRQWPLLVRVGKSRVTYCGPSGAGQIAKAVNQLAMGLVDAAYLESLAYGVRAGLEPAVLLAAVGDTSGFRQHFAQVANRVIAGEGDALDAKYAEYAYFLTEADNVGFPAPLLRALQAWLLRFPTSRRDGMGRPYPPFWSSLMSTETGRED
jgi:3-hydroxyisobutyrate dehydrogenase-like beta-hydroxyacid dehydrogenase